MTPRRKLEAALFVVSALGIALLASVRLPSTQRLVLPITLGVLGVLGISLVVDTARWWRARRLELDELASRKALGHAYEEAFERGNAEELARLRRRMDQMSASPTSASARARKSVGLGEELIVREQWSEARDVLASIDRSLLPAATRPGILNNLAFATALAGDPETACKLAEQALSEAGDDPTYPEEKLGFLRGTHGVALSLAGRHEEAASRLEPVLDGPGPPRATATRAFYLGVSLWALGREDEARQAWELGARRAGPFAERSRDKLSLPPPRNT